MKTSLLATVFFLLVGFPLLSEAQIVSASGAIGPYKGSSPGGGKGFRGRVPGGNVSALTSMPETILSAWISLGPVTQNEVMEASLASDGTRLLTFFRQPEPSLNLDGGILKEWTGSGWIDLARLTSQCHDPDVAVKGNLGVACWSDDGNDYGFGSNINGPWVSLTGTLLKLQWGMTVAIAQNRPYMTFASRYSDGQPFPYMMLHIISPLGAGKSAELHGGWRDINIDVGTDPAIAGGASGWYVVFRQGSNLYVKKGYTSGEQSFREDVGGGFTVSGSPYNPEIALYIADPIVVWLEEGGKKIYVARWDGTGWFLIGSASRDTGFFYSLRAAVRGSSLYLVFASSEGSPRISVNKWDGISWSEFAGPLESNSAATISTVDVAIHEGQPVVSFVENRVLKVMKFGTATEVAEENLPTEYRLSQNYPNPFNPTTKIRYGLPGRVNVSLKIYDLLGREVASLVNEQKPVGRYDVSWDATGMPSGVYFYRLQAGEFVETKKLILLR